MDALGGTGKTFLINLLLAKIWLDNQIALAVASSGIAATLLTGGRTAHSALKLPLNLATADASSPPVLDIAKGTGKADVLRHSKFIVWDECTMSHKLAFEALDRSLQDLRNSNQVMGGATLLLAGDFRQTLPVIPRGTAADELKACLKASILWRHVRKLTLSTKLRVVCQGDTSARQFSKLLLGIRDGKVPVDSNGQIKIPSGCGNIVNSPLELEEKVYPNIANYFQDHNWLCERAILAPKNDTVNAINNRILKDLPTQSRVYRSIDTVAGDESILQYPTEFLNSLEPAGVPQHRLELKVGAPIILMRNLDAPKLCNGTRLAVKKLMPHVIEATILTGCAKGEDVFIPRIPIILKDLPFDFKRIQFPVRLSFAMSINKAQGQSLKVSGIELNTECFSHGQLYVACSRVGTCRSLFIWAPDGKTKNVVY